MGFYFFEDPSEIRQPLIAVIEAFAEHFPQRFSRISDTGDTFRNFAKSKKAATFLRDQIAHHDFYHSLFLMLSDAHKDTPPTQRILFWGRTLYPEFKSRTPNYLYFELPVTTDISTCWQLFQDAFHVCNFYLGVGNFVMSADDDSMPRSGATAAREVRDSQYILHTFDGTFRNHSYLTLLERKSSQFLIHPSQFIGVGREIKNNLKELNLAFPIDEKLIRHTNDDCVLVRADTTDELRVLSETLSPFYGDVECPQMFWKPDPWKEWVSNAKSTKELRV